MQYRTNPKNNDQISALGFGCMRFNRDKKEVEKQLLHAISQGVNYFDTAYIYGDSEAVLGRILAENNLRSQVKIATKLPGYLARKAEDFDKYFKTELERLQTDYIDYYLIHMLVDLKSWQRLTGMGLLEWIAERKKQGQIRNIGFSFHGLAAEFIGILDAYDWDFCMIQYNYLDENVQAGRSGLEYAGSKRIPVMVMEPLRGGTLVHKLPPAAAQVWNQAEPCRSPADWGLRWVLNHPQVLCVLSGMGSMEMVQENIRTASDALPNTRTAEDDKLYEQVKTKIREATRVSCTGCGYCMPCPVGVDIPMCFSSLNDTVIKGKPFTRYWYIMMTDGHNASQCVQCGKCEAHCPQAIPIREKLIESRKVLEGFPYKPMRFFLKKIIRK